VGNIVLVEFMSLDGVIQAPGNAQEDPEGFPHGGWTQPFFDDHRRYMPEILTAAGAYLFGRSTFDIFAAYWPTVTDPDDRIAGALNARPKYVVSHTLDEPTWGPATVLSGAVPEKVAALKAEITDDLLVIGSARLAQTLIVHDLVDEYRLWLHPIVLGSGKRLFPDRATPLTLKAVDFRTTGDGLVIATYRRP
jgi:dihydrofolate reductase